jgi:hypothetical protein
MGGVKWAIANAIQNFGGQTAVLFTPFAFVSPFGSNTKDTAARYSAVSPPLWARRKGLRHALTSTLECTYNTASGKIWNLYF